MPIKLIAVDMDGTFLNDDMDYDRGRFQQQYYRLKQQGIRFVVASGNQYYQLRSFFPDLAGDIAFVAENGAYVVDQDAELFCAGLSRDHYHRALTALAKYPWLEIIVCCPTGAYALASARADFVADMKKYYHRLARVASFADVTETAFKFALSLPNAYLADFMQEIAVELAGALRPVSSGHGSVDLIIPGMHKANGLKLLQRLWNVRDDEVAAFGDGGNDLEMLRQAGFGYAMANAPAAIKAAARFSTRSNNDAGVLRVIDDILERKPPFA